MQTKSFKKETDALHRIAQASEAIRRKHRLIRMGKESVHQAMSDVLQPVVAPLEKLVTHSEVEKKQKDTNLATLKKRGRRRRRALSPPLPLEDNYKTAFEDDEYMDLPPTLNSSRINDSLQVFSPKSSSPIEKLAEPSESPHNDNETQRLLHLYLDQLNTKPSSLDTRYGVRNLKSGMRIGDTPVTFDNNVMKLGNQQYILTPGLIELTFQKSPNMSLVTEADKQKYGTILLTTNAARKRYKADSSFRSDSKLPKYVKVIKNLFRSEQGEEGTEDDEVEEQMKTGSALPQYLIASRRRPPADYIYWDDPNELVERLRLLIASQSAGNPSHSNEIMAIIEELREAEIIY